ncbi:uncharacterized protein LOC105662238 isoform X2 [Megachile rotundata]|uniref:uncharacterized protein LOC105662238 isoform X2 n=1 Tax=Megachile rotundata TaxID=143995 RepID=UPI003FD298BE
MILTFTCSGIQIICLGIEIFHHVHHSVNRMNREDDESIPFLPEERNPVFYIYPMCIVLSTISAILWLFTKVLIKRPEIGFIGCFIAAILLLSAGVIEMKHADIYLDLTIIRDEELLTHPVFLHNFIMCLVSLFGMAIYLMHGWIIMDFWLQIKKEKRDRDNYNDNEDYNENGEDDSLEHHRRSKKRESKNAKETEEPGELDPIPALEKFPSVASLSQDESISELPVILYCCFLDCCMYIKHHHFTERPVHEFQVIHTM